ncbi:MAG: pilin [Candidatus Nomurabacteria bacterium]|jgi:hypothetical protein|nr:pilin [Candidatus Nomurabacteria bacterium]
MKEIIKKLSLAILLVPLLALGVNGIVGDSVGAADNKWKPDNGWGPQKVDSNGQKKATDVTKAQWDVCVGNKVANGYEYNTATADCSDPKAYANKGIDNVWGFATTIIGWVLIAVGIICVVFIIIGGIKYATSGGDSEKVKSAKNTLLYAIIGLAVALLAYLIVNLVTSTMSTLTA